MILKQLLQLITVLLLFTLVAPVYGAEPRLVKVGAFNLYPAIFKDTDGQIKGFYVDALTDLAKRENLRIEYVYGSWSEGLERIKTGQVDILTSVAHTPERASYMDYTTTPLLTVWGELYVHPSSDIDGIRDVAGKVVAIMKGDMNGQHFVTLVRSFNISCTFKEFSSFDEIFQALADKRVDAGVVNNTFGAPRQQQYGLRSTGVIFNPFNIYFTVAKDRNQELLQLLDTYLGKWRNDKDSAYALARQKWSHAAYQETSHQIPGWLKHTILGLILLTASAIIFIIMLRHQVRAKTETVIQRERSLLENTQMTRLLLDSTAEAIFSLDLDGNCTLCNAACLRMLGYQQPEQLLGKSMHDLIHHTRSDGTPHDRNECPIIKTLSSGQKAHSEDEMMWRSDNSGFPVEYWAYPITSDNRIVGVVVTFLDITERRLASQQRIDSEQRYRQLFEASPDGIVLINTEGLIIEANNSQARMYRYESPKELIGIHATQLVAESARDLSRETMSRRLRGEHLPQVEYEVVRSDGTTFSAEVSAKILKDQDGNINSYICITRDITERKLSEQQHRVLEEQLRHSQRMEAIGTLAGGIAHDFNNILTAIIGYAHISQIGLPAEAPQRVHIQQITEAANRATHLTRDLLLFSRKQSSNKRLLNLNELVNNTHSFLQRIIGEKIRLVTRLPEQAVMLDADPQQLDQVLMNLATNARDAMPEGGTITISISCEQYDDTTATQHNLPKGAKYAVIQFCDDGRGIPAELLDKIFDPFFTTKEVGKGTGLGLPIVYGIITNHHGALKVVSSPGNGSCFTVHLPCSHQQEPAAVTPQVDEQLPRGNGEIILLAEDNERIRNMASQVLTEFGYQVLTAVDGDDAVRLFQQHADQVKLLLFDLVMPTKGGYEAYQQIQQLNPSIRIIFTTGYAPEMADNKLNQQQLDRLLHKPFAVVQLLKTVRNVLDAEENQA